MDLYGAIFGKDFRWTWVAGETPLSSITEIVLAVVIYLAVIGTIREVMRNRQPFELKWLAFFHNAFLSSFSLLLLVLILENILPKMYAHGFLYTICNPQIFKDGRLEILLYFNYLTKYYELLDTAFLALKKKTLPFLHVYHHAATMVLCFVELTGNVSIQWLVIVLNLFVHVLMYYYYACALLKIEIWWKKHLTTLQITQFVIDLTCVYLATAQGYIWMRFPSLIDYTWGNCHGTEIPAFFGAFVLTSYLYLFVQFFIDTYLTRGKRPAPTKEKKE